MEQVVFSEEGLMGQELLELEELRDIWLLCAHVFVKLESLAVCRVAFKDSKKCYREVHPWYRSTFT